jgi:putative SOS response-associated peptidase YedK
MEAGKLLLNRLPSIPFFCITMCGRASLTVNEAELEERFDSDFYSEDLERYNPIPNYNIAPTHFLPLLIDKHPGQFQIYRWGLIPFWSKDIKIASKMINTRVETILENLILKLQFNHAGALFLWMVFTSGKRQNREKNIL